TKVQRTAQTKIGTRSHPLYPVGAENSDFIVFGVVVGWWVGSAAVGRSRGVVLSFAYWSLRRLLELVVLRLRSEREKEIEILLLRHQLRVLERQVARPQLTQADRALLAAFSRVWPRQAWRRPLLVKPASL